MGFNSGFKGLICHSASEMLKMYSGAHQQKRLKNVAYQTYV